MNDWSKGILYSMTIMLSDGFITRGVTVHRGDRVFGGSDQYYHVGTRRREDGRITVEVHLSTYSDREHGQHVEFDTTTSGDYDPERMTLEGEATMPTGPMGVMLKLIKQCEVD